jgi:3-oxoacyl-[acyl-carrier-protein] synthase II
MRFTVKGIGWVTPLGIGSGRPGETLQFGSGRPWDRQSGSPNAMNRVWEPYPDWLSRNEPIRRSALPGALKSSHFLEEPHPRFGRFDSYAKAGFGAIALALRSAHLDRWTQKRAIGLVVGTRLGCLEADRAYFQTAAFQGGTLASPNLFAYTLPSTMLGEASIQFGLTGASFVVDDSDGYLAGIHAALDLLRWGLCETAVGGWFDVNARVVNEREEGPCGAVFFVLAKGSEAAPWQWDGRELRQGTQRITDLAGVARGVLEMPREPEGDDSER